MHSEQSIKKFLAQNIESQVLRAQLTNLFEGVRELAYENGRRDALSQKPLGRPPLRIDRGGQLTTVRPSTENIDL